MRTRLVIGLALAFTLACPPLRAEPTAYERSARAQELFDAAMRDVDRGDFPSACRKFAASQDTEPRVSTLMNLGNCYVKSGRPASAFGAFTKAAALARQTGRDVWVARARDAARPLEDTIGKLVVEVADPVPGLVVERDGVAITAKEWDVAVLIDPGRHRVVASAPGYQPFEVTRDVSPDERLTTIAVPKLTPMAPAPPRAAVAAPPGFWSPARVTGAAIAGTGATALLVSGVLAVVASTKYDAARSACREAGTAAGIDTNDGRTQCPTAALDDASSATGLANMGTGFAIGGAALLAVGGALIVFGKPSGQPSVGVRLLPNGLLVGGAFR